jgi:hypothetical protein
MENNTQALELPQGVTPDFLISQLRQRFSELSDHRASNSSFHLTDILMSGFAMFSLKYASLLQFETQTEVEQVNLHQLYGIKELCSDSQMRKVLDLVNPNDLREMYAENFQQLQRLGITDAYRSYQDYLLVAIDGVTHFESKQVNCPCCLVKTHKDASISYSHSMLCAMLVKPGQKEVFVMGTEPILCQDGQEKNDCERSASKRLLDEMALHYKDEKLLITEDALYSTGPNISQITDNNWSYVLGIKPDGNKSLFKCFDEQPPSHRVKKFSYLEKGVNHHFKYVNNLPLNGTNAQLRVNVLLYEQTDKKGKTTKFSWVTNLVLDRKSAVEVMRIGRSRWKIENETFNTLKNQGYQFEHNYGHGKKNLSTVLAYLMLLAFHTDQLIQRCNQPFQQIWKAAKTKVKLWQTIRALFMVQIFLSFQQLYNTMAALFKVKLE